MPEERDSEEAVLKEASSTYEVATNDGIDLSLLKDNLAKTPWERMQANDDALNFAESLRGAVKISMQNPDQPVI